MLILVKAGSIRAVLRKKNIVKNRIVMTIKLEIVVIL